MFKQFTVYSLIFLEHKTKQAVAEPSGKKFGALLTELKQKSEIFWLFSEFQNKLQNNLVNCFCHITTLNAWFYHQPLYPELWYSTCSAQNLSCSQHFFSLISSQLMDTCLGPAFRKLHWSLTGKNQLAPLQLLQSTCSWTEVHVVASPFLTCLKSQQCPVPLDSMFYMR